MDRQTHYGPGNCISNSISGSPERDEPRPADALVAGGDRQASGPGRGHDQPICGILMKCVRKLIHCHDNRRSDPPHLDSSRRGSDSQPVSEIVVQMQSTSLHQQGEG